MGITIYLNLSIYLFNYMSIYLNLSIYLFNYMSIYLNLSIYLFDYMSIYLNLSIYLFNYMSICLGSEGPGSAWVLRLDGEHGGRRRAGWAQRRRLRPRRHWGARAATSLPRYKSQPQDSSWNQLQQLELTTVVEINYSS